MENPFNKDYRNRSDLELLDAIRQGSRAALEALIKRHQHFIYNVAYKMVLNTEDAEDITQDVLIKVITKLSQFKGKSEFRTWLYRIVVNHLRDMKRKTFETMVSGFDDYGKEIDAIPDIELNELERLALKEVVEEAKLSCMNGMLLCLNREQRLVYILGEIFGADHNFGSSILEITPANFRKKLSRARKDLYNFMHNKCGLINKEAPCRCHKKTKGFIKAGIVDPENIKFNTAYISKISQVAQQKSADLDSKMDQDYADLFRDQPFQEKTHIARLLNTLLQDTEISNIFDLN